MALPMIVSFAVPCLLLLPAIQAQLAIDWFSVPRAAKSGTDVTLHCNTTNIALLYLLRWYRDELEFYRYMPDEKPAKKEFGIVKVDLVQSSGHSVVLTNVASSASGHYKCEISAEAPSFETDTREAILHVVDPPKGKPFINLVSVKLNVQHPFAANCSGPKGRPAPQLIWTIGSIQVEDIFTSKVITNMAEENLESMTSQLELPAGWLEQHASNITSHYISGSSGEKVTELRCISRLYALYEDADQLDIRLLAKSSALPGDKSSQFQSSQKPPKLSLHGGYVSSCKTPFHISTVSLMALILLHLLV